MQSLRGSVGYVSLKTKHLELMAAQFPSLTGFDMETKSNMEEKDEGQFESQIQNVDDGEKKSADR